MIDTIIAYALGHIILTIGLVILAILAYGLVACVSNETH